MQRAYHGLAYIKIIFRALMRSSWLAARCRDFTAFLRFTAAEPFDYRTYVVVEVVSGGAWGGGCHWCHSSDGTTNEAGS